MCGPVRAEPRQHDALTGHIPSPARSSNASAEHPRESAGSGARRRRPPASRPKGNFEMAEETNARQLLVFSLGEEEYALPVTSVQEIIHYTHAARGAPARLHWIQGVISLRGKIIPVADLSARLGLYNERVEGGKIVVVESGAITAGVVVDDVDEVLTVDDDAARRGPGRGHRGDRRHREDRRPPDHPARPRQPVRRRRPRRRGLAERQHATEPSTDGSASPASSSPTTPASCAGFCRPPWRRSATTSSASARTATRRSRCASACAPTR